MFLFRINRRRNLVFTIRRLATLTIILTFYIDIVFRLVIQKKLLRIKHVITKLLRGGSLCLSLKGAGLVGLRVFIWNGVCLQGIQSIVQTTSHLIVYVTDILIDGILNNDRSCRRGKIF